VANLFKNKEDQEIKVGKPNWLKTKISSGKEYRETKQVVKDHKLHTICESGNCPNQAECWGAGTATFMILGNTCTRSCQFCNVATGKPEDVDPFEAARVAKSIKLMGLKHAVITSVDRDYLKDGGAAAWKKTVELTRQHNPGITIETLIPDFKGEWENLQPIIDVAPEVVSHNMETVRRITAQVRVQAKYDRSLEVLKRLKDGGIERTKSGIMVGLGEFKEEVLTTMDDLRSVGVSIMTIGQYMQPSKKHLAIAEFVHPDVFAFYKEEGMKRGFTHVESGPLVRSSYHAEKHL
jgi:lipoic acid synthetase